MAESSNSEKLALQFDSLSVHAGLNRAENEVKDIPIHASSSFVFNSSAHGAAIFNMTAEAFCYSRIANPTVDVFEKRMAALEGGEAALATASGEAALFVTISALASSGSNIIVASHISEISTHQFKHRFPPLGITARFISHGDVSEVHAAIDSNTKAIFIESISSAEQQLADISALASVARSNGLPLIVDNTNGAGGFFIRPFEHGASIVLHSCTPWLSISGSSIGGVIIDSGAFPWSSQREKFPQFSEPSPGFHGLKIVEKFGRLAFVAYARIAVMRDVGPCLNPFEAAMLLAGLETLGVRMERVRVSTGAIRTWLEGCEGIVDVKDPGLANHSAKYLPRGYGGLLSFTLREEADVPALLSKFKFVSRGTSIGGSRTLLIPFPADLLSTSSIEDKQGTCRPHPRIYISVGLEDIDDIIGDFEQAFA